MYIFFRCHFEVLMMSREFSTTDAYPNVELINIQPSFYEPDGGASSEELELDLSMEMPTYSLQMDPSKSTSRSHSLLILWWYPPLWGVVSVAEDVSKASSALAQFHVGKDVAGVVDIGMSLEVGKWFCFLLRLVSHQQW